MANRLISIAYPKCWTFSQKKRPLILDSGSTKLRSESIDYCNQLPALVKVSKQLMRTH